MRRQSILQVISTVTVTVSITVTATKPVTMTVTVTVTWGLHCGVVVVSVVFMLGRSTFDFELCKFRDIDNVCYSFSSMDMRMLQCEL